MHLETTMLDYHHGQADYQIVAMTDDRHQRVIGVLNFTEYQDRPAISMIEVLPEYRSQGIGKKLVAELQRRYPDEEIDWGYQTDSGSALKKSLPYRRLPRPEIISMLERLKKVETDLRRLEIKLDYLPADQRNRWIQTVHQRWDRLLDLRRRLKDQLATDSRPEKLIIDVDKLEK